LAEVVLRCGRGRPEVVVTFPARRLPAGIVWRKAEFGAALWRKPPICESDAMPLSWCLMQVAGRAVGHVRQPERLPTLRKPDGLRGRNLTHLRFSTQFCVFGLPQQNL